MPRRTRKPRPRTQPSLRIAVIEHVEVEGKRFAHHDVLFEADVPARVQTTQQMTPLQSATTTITCLLSAAQGQHLWHGLKERYRHGQECAWCFHVGADQETMCIGYMTHMAVRQETEDGATYTLTFVDSGHRTFPVRHSVTP